MSYEVPKSFEKFKEMENGKGTKNVRNHRILRTLGNFLVFLDFDFFQESFEHPLSIMNLFKQYSRHMMSQNILKSSKKWKMWRVRRM